MPGCSVIPELVYSDVLEAARWLCLAFGFSLRWHAGSHRVQLAVGNGGAVALTEARAGEGWRGSADQTVLREPRVGEVVQALIVCVGHVDSHHEHALRAGAHILHPPTDYPYGERQYTAEDLAGHRWSFSQSIADVAPEEWGGSTAELG
jgi:uncharacterized glyoxalase superfamily protein PhnB